MTIRPLPSPLTEPYWTGACNGLLLLQCCRVCRSLTHPPLPVCRHCQSEELEWTAASGRGVIYSFTVSHHAVHETLETRLPYVIALVDLAEGPRVVCNILHCAASEVAIGMRVRLVFEQVAPDFVLPQFEPE